MTEDAGQVRVCEYRRCGAPLPPAVGRGSRARFCQDGKTWGRRNLSCRDAEAVLSDAESLRESDTELDDTAVTALAGQVDRVLEPTRGLVETLTTLRHQLEATTVAALAERDAALTETDEHRLHRGRAEAEAAQARDAAETAVAAAAEAEREKTAALRERDEERAARQAAVQEQQRADGQLAAVRDELARVADRADASAALAGERAAVIATLTAELTAARTTLEEERGRGQAAAARADALQERLDTLREDYARAIAAQEAALNAAREDQAKAIAAREATLNAARDERAEAAAALDRARAEAERLRAGFDQRLTELQAAHEQTVRSMHETTTNLGAELRTAAGRADAAERELSGVLAALRETPELPATLKQLLD
jgi:chromosome segregation ATPase